jgi:hypothetical protein
MGEVAMAAGDGSRKPRDVAPEVGNGRRRAGPSLDTSTEVDRLEELGEEIARLAAHLHAGRARFLELVAAFDRRRGWEPGGHRSCAHWLSFRTGYDLRTARGYVRAARALETLPATREAMARGRLAFSQVRALTRVATPETESDLLALAEGCTTATLERRVRAWKRGSRQDEAARERALHRARRLACYPDEDGMYVLRARLEPEVGAVLLRAIEAAADALYREDRAEREGTAGGATAQNGTPPGSGGCSTEHPSPRQRRRQAARRRADAMGLLAERALAAGFGGGGDEAGEEDEDDGDAPISGTRAERYQAFLFVDADTLREEGEPGRSELEDGTRVAPASARRLACDVAAVHMNRGADGSVLDVGRRTRTVPPALRRALEVRDRGCRFPGCGLRFTDAHHVTHWADGGETSLENTLLLCRRHHRLVHEEGWTVEWWGKTRAVFTDPRGGRHLDERPPVPELPARPVAALQRENRRRGTDPGPWDAAARWKREDDVPIEVWMRATEAGLTGAATAGAAAKAPP